MRVQIESEKDLEKLDSLIGKRVHAVYSGGEALGELVKEEGGYKLKLGGPFPDIKVEPGFLILEESSALPELKLGEEIEIVYRGVRRQMKRRLVYEGTVDGKLCGLDEKGVRVYISPEDVLEIRKLKP